MCASSMGSLPPASCKTETVCWLKETYIGYRTLLHHLSLEERRRVVDAAEHAQRRARVQEIWRETFG